MLNKFQFIPLWTLLKKEVVRFLRIWAQTLLPSLVTTVLYYTIFGQFVGDRIGTIQGMSYLKFIIPGLIMNAIITNAYSNVASSFFSTKFHRSLEEILVAPISTHIIVIGYVAGGVIRSGLVFALLLCLTHFFVSYSVNNWLVVLTIFALTAISFSLCGLINASYARSFEGISIVPTFCLTPLIYLGGVFYPVSELPLGWKTISFLNPIVYIINGFRVGFFKQHGTASLGVIFLALTLFLVILYLWAYSLLARSHRIYS